MSRRQNTPDSHEREHYRLLVVGKSRDVVHLGEPGAGAVTLCVYNMRQTDSIRRLSDFEGMPPVCTNCREVSDKRKAEAGRTQGSS